MKKSIVVIGIIILVMGISVFGYFSPTIMLNQYCENHPATPSCKDIMSIIDALNYSAIIGFIVLIYGLTAKTRSMKIKNCET